MNWLKVTGWHLKAEGGLHSRGGKYGIWFKGGILWFDTGSDVHKAVHGFNHHKGYEPRLSRDKCGGVGFKEKSFHFCIEDLEQGSGNPRWYFHEYDNFYEQKAKIKREVTLPVYLAMPDYGIF